MPSRKRTHEQAAVGRSVDGDPVGGAVSLTDQVLRGTLEVIKAVLFVSKVAT